MSDYIELMPHCPTPNPNLCDGCLRDLAGTMARELHYDASHAERLPLSEYYGRSASDLTRTKRFKAMVIDICSGDDLDREYNRELCGVVDPFYHSEFVSEDPLVELPRMQRAANRVGSFALGTAGVLVVLALLAVGSQAFFTVNHRLLTRMVWAAIGLGGVALVADMATGRKVAR